MVTEFKLPEIRGEYRFNYNLAKNSWFKVGGNAQIFFKPEDKEDLKFFLKTISTEIPICIIGNCSNLIIRDGGIEGVVIKLGRNFAQIRSLDGCKIAVGAGALNSTVANFAMQNGIGGLEFLIGIPGTIGGGIRMNAGSYGTEFKDILESFTALDKNGNEVNFPAGYFDFSYRNSNLPEDLIFVEAIFKGEKAEPAVIKEKMREISEKRAETQPIKEKTGGSTFANGENYKAWELIDKAGLRGYKIGGAEFSKKHCNFLINTGDSTAKELEDLGELAIKKVRENFNIELKWEIKRIGSYEEVPHYSKD